MTSGDILTASQIRLLKRWQQHLTARRVTVPTADDFRSFGSLSQLERLRRALSISHPQHCGPMRLVLRELRQIKTRKQSATLRSTGTRGPTRRLSSTFAELPQEWRDILADMRNKSQRRDAGLLVLTGPVAPAPAIIRGITYTLRSICKICHDQEVTPTISKATITLWLNEQETRKRRKTGISIELRGIHRFCAYAGIRPKLQRRLEELAAEQTRLGRKQRKRKYQRLDQFPLTIGEAFLTAEDLLAQSIERPAGSDARHVLILHAAAIALSVNTPLRIGDLSRLRFGSQLKRDVEGWSMTINIRKTRGHYHAPCLWPETTPFLDALLTTDAVGADLWSAYEQRIGTPVFSEDGGQSALSADWISDVFYKRFGIGQHIIRTLWHEEAYDSGDDLTHMALSLCGQSGERTEREYREQGARKQNVKLGRDLLKAARRRENITNIQ